MPEQMISAKVLLVHNRYQQAGGEDEVVPCDAVWSDVETCKPMEDRERCQLLVGPAEPL
jgi:hypothetical protein